MDTGARVETERWFVRHGVPHFIEDYDAQRDIWTRTAPFLVLVFLAQTLNAVNLEAGWSWWVNVLAFFGGVAIALGAWAVLCRVRHRRVLQLPDRIGPAELAVFVLVPPLIPLVFGGQVGSAGTTFVGNLVLLAVAYFVTSYALFPLTVWGIRRFLRELGTVFTVMMRALPLLLLVLTFLFFTTEVWQLAGSLEWRLALLAALFLLVATLFALLRAPRQLAELETAGGPERAELVAGTPIEADVAGMTPLPPRQPLNARQRGNVVLVVVASEGVQVVLVVTALFGFFVLLGFLALDASVMNQWLGAEPDVLATLSIGSQDFVLTSELLTVAVLLASFGGLFFTVSLLTDTTYGEEFLPEVLDDVERALAVRDVYLAALHRS